MFIDLAVEARNLPTFDPYDIKKSLVGLADDYFQLQNIDLYESFFWDILFRH